MTNRSISTSLRNTDLNLLLVFDALFRSRSTTRAADELHLTQPAVSNALKRLRTLFDDELFVSTREGMLPTTRATEIATLVSEGLGSFRLALQAHRPFEPAAATRTFHLYVSDLAQAIFLPPLAEKVHRAAPGVRIVTVDPPLYDAQQMMTRGEIDLAIGMFSGLDSEFHQQRLFEENYVALFRSDHPFIEGSLTAAQFLDADHLIYTPTAGSHAKFEGALEAIFKQHGKTRSVAMQVAHSVSLDRIVAASNMVACIPSRLAHTLSGQEDVRSCPLPFDIQPMDIVQLWHAQFHRDDGHRWLRTLVYELFHDERRGISP
ncbi:LysR family transcriptional regulator [Paraburkholderia diazotrophica]|uniref:DNA-binding transcriptional regulator, LysR family n=1 Tax=Paraburkholderia diazotrophica TaxID=667676 RepID=A0A1H7CQU9_9BURK|nr:LysR family transcriptional regulator [Paraburkholderia diazotrophica]SEJ91846.1 DNA-binding transcriptional regulator, LysR family [Paraburkholderia diazotrophica]